MSASAHRRLHDPRYLQLHIPGNGHIADVSGHGNVTAWVGTPAYATGPYSGRSMIELDGDAKAINCGNVTAFNAVSQFTFACVAIQDVAGATDGLLYQFTDTNNRIAVQTSSGLLILYVSSGSSSDGYINSSALIASGVPFHLAMVFDGTLTGNANRLRLYIDGFERAMTYDGTIPAVTANFGPANPMYLGKVPVTTWDGKIGNARFYSCALTGDEVAALYEYDTR